MATQQPDLFNLYFRLRERTEPPLIFHRWSLITALGAYLGRQYWLPFGDGRIFPTFYTMLIGVPASRKSTAIKLGKKLIAHAGYDKFSAEKTSKEKFLLDLEGVPEEEVLASLNSKRKGKKNDRGGKQIDTIAELFGEDEDRSREPHEVFIVADEFNEFVGSGNLEFLSLLGMLWDWDDENNNYQFRLKNSKSVSIYQPTISILSGNTHAGFVEAFPPAAIGQGFLSRLVLVYSEPSGKKESFPPPPDPVLLEEIIGRLREIKQRVVGPAELTEDAARALDIIYTSWKPLEDNRFTHYTGRRFTHLLHICLIIAATNCRTKITEEDVIYANSILTYTEIDMPKALGEFGKSRDSDVMNKIMQMLYEANSPVPVNKIIATVRHDVEKNSQVGDMLAKLINSGQIQQVKLADGSGAGYLPKQKPLSSKILYCNFELLKEYQMKHGGLRRVK